MRVGSIKSVAPLILRIFQSVKLIGWFHLHMPVEFKENNWIEQYGSMSMGDPR